MTLGFTFNRAADRGFQMLCIAWVFTQRGTEIGHVLLSQAHVQFPRTCQTDAVTAFAEIMT